MTNHTLEFKLEKPFANLYRDRHTLIAVLDEDRNIILGRKKSYPEGIYRLMGGGVDQEESYDEAAIREVKEEMDIDNPKLEPLTKITVQARTPDDEFTLETSVYYFKAKATNITPSDDINEIQTVKPEEMLDLIEKYKNLTGVFTSGDYSHNWSDYGKVYAKIHKIVYDELKIQGLIL